MNCITIISIKAVYIITKYVELLILLIVCNLVDNFFFYYRLAFDIDLKHIYTSSIILASVGFYPQFKLT